MLEWLDSEFAAAMKRIERVIDRVVHFRARSEGQKVRRDREAFELRLALALGKTVDELRREMNPEDIAEWQAVYCEPTK